MAKTLYETLNEIGNPRSLECYGGPQDGEIVRRSGWQWESRKGDGYYQAVGITFAQKDRPTEDVWFWRRHA